MGRRRTGRELALQMAYWIDQKGLGPDGVSHALRVLPVLDDESVFEKETGEAEELPQEAEPGAFFTDRDWEEAKSFAGDIVRGTLRELAAVDGAIARVSEHWVPGRMPAVDRNILRLACYELLFREDIPPKVTINEWIEVAKKYSTEKSGPFINGVLDHLRKEMTGTGKPAKVGTGPPAEREEK